MSHFTNDPRNPGASAKEGTFFGPIFSVSLARKNILLGVIGACLYGGLILLGVVLILLGSGLLTGNYYETGPAKAMLIGSVIGMIIESLLCFTLGFLIYRGSHIAAIVALVGFVIEKLIFHPRDFNIGHAVIPIFIIVLLAYGVRGTLALKKIKEAPQFQ